MMNPTKNRRKNFLINPRFQLWFLGYSLGAALVTLVIFYLSKVIFFSSVKSYLLSLGLPADHMVYDFLSQQSRVLDLIFLGAGLIEALFLGITGLMISHRVAGPLYRLNQDLIAMAKDKSGKAIRFRKYDYFQEIPESFNKFIDSIKR